MQHLDGVLENDVNHCQRGFEKHWTRQARNHFQASRPSHQIAEKRSFSKPKDYEINIFLVSDS